MRIAHSEPHIVNPIPWPETLSSLAAERLLRHLPPGDRARLRATCRAGRDLVDCSDVMVGDYKAYPLSARAPRRAEPQKVEAGSWAERASLRLGTLAVQVLGTACVAYPVVSLGVPGWWPWLPSLYETLVWTTLWRTAHTAVAFSRERWEARRRGARALGTLPQEVIKAEAETALGQLERDANLSVEGRRAVLRIISRAVHVLHGETRRRPVLASSLMEIRARAGFVCGPYQPPFRHIEDTPFAEALDTRNKTALSAWLALCPEGSVLQGLYVDDYLLPTDLTCGLAHLFTLGISPPPVWQQVFVIEDSALSRACEAIKKVHEVLPRLRPCPLALRSFTHEVAFRSLWMIAMHWSADRVSASAFEVRLAHLGIDSVQALPSLTDGQTPCRYEQEEIEMALLERDARSRLPRDRRGVLCRRLRRRFDAVDIDQRASLPAFSRLCADIGTLEA